MKTFLFGILLAVTMVACGAPQKANTPPSPLPPPAPAIPSLAGTWTGIINGVGTDTSIGVLSLGQSNGHLAGTLTGWSVAGCGSLDGDVTSGSGNTGIFDVFGANGFEMMGTITGPGIGNRITGTLVINCIITNQQWSGSFAMSRG